MNLTQIEKHAKALMTVHGVGHLEFKWSNGKRTIGYCRSVRVQTSDHTHVWVAKSIHLSKLYAANLPIEQIEDTILHEIAHAKAGHEAAHGPAWAREAIKLGIKPDRCGKVDFRPERAWKGFCPNCEKQVADQHRAPLRVSVCARSECRNIHITSKIIRWEKNDKRVPICEMPARYQENIKSVIRRYQK